MRDKLPFLLEHTHNNGFFYWLNSLFGMLCSVSHFTHGQSELSSSKVASPYSNFLYGFALHHTPFAQSVGRNKV